MHPSLGADAQTQGGDVSDHRTIFERTMANAQSKAGLPLAGTVAGL